MGAKEGAFVYSKVFLMDGLTRVQRVRYSNGAILQRGGGSGSSQFKDVKQTDKFQDWNERLACGVEDMEGDQIVIPCEE